MDEADEIDGGEEALVFTDVAPSARVAQHLLWFYRSQVGLDFIMYFSEVCTSGLELNSRLKTQFVLGLASSERGQT